MPATVLLVEDDADQAQLFAQVLHMSGYAVTTAANAAEGQAHLAAAPFALLLADWDLGGGMQGDALIAWAKEQYPGSKAILFSNHPEVENVAAASGADAWFRKIDGIAKFRQLVTCLAPPNDGMA